MSTSSPEPGLGQGPERVTAPEPESAPAPSLGGRVRGRLAQARRLWRDFTGESAYDRYVERHAREHPGHPPMSEREWWRAKDDYDEKHVQARCC